MTNKETNIDKLIDKQINHKSIRANTPDWQEGYEQGLLSGYTKSIVLNDLYIFACA
jgi:hypothetical protein